MFVSTMSVANIFGRTDNRAELSSRAVQAGAPFGGRKSENVVHPNNPNIVTPPEKIFS